MFVEICEERHEFRVAPDCELRRGGKKKGARAMEMRKYIPFKTENDRRLDEGDGGEGPGPLGIGHVHAFGFAPAGCGC